MVKDELSVEADGVIVGEGGDEDGAGEGVASCAILMFKATISDSPFV